MNTHAVRTGEHSGHTYLDTTVCLVTHRVGACAVTRGIGGQQEGVESVSMTMSCCDRVLQSTRISGTIFSTIGKLNQLRAL